MRVRASFATVGRGAWRLDGDLDLSGGPPPLGLRPPMQMTSRPSGSASNERTTSRATRVRSVPGEPPLHPNLGRADVAQLAEVLLRPVGHRPTLAAATASAS
jgi:hypothetical protein